MNGQEIIFWCQSTGTTAKRKLFPITKSYLFQHQRTLRPFAFELIRQRPSFGFGKALVLPAPDSGEITRAGLRVGLISNISFRSIPPFLKKAYALPVELLQNEAIFNDWTPYYALANDLSAIAAVTPARILNLIEVMKTKKELYLSAIKGRTSVPNGLPAVTVSKERIELIERVLENRVFKLKELWPKLSMISVWKSSTCGWQLKELEPYLSPEVLVVDAQYAASEGALTVPFISPRLGGRFHPGAIIAEFCEYGQDPQASNLLKPWQLRDGGSYEVFLTSTMGLVRYRLYDVVTVKGFYKNTPNLSFQCKADNSISLGQTRFSESALLEATRESRLDTHYRWVIAPDTSGKRLIFWCEEDSSEARLGMKRLESAWKKITPIIQSDYDLGLLEPMEFRKLTASQLQQLDSLQHAQSKRRIFLKEPLS